MSLPKYTGSTNIISQLSDTPSITSTQLKAKFDEAETGMKNYLNNDLTTAVEQLVATEKQSLQTSINELDTELTGDINTAISTENAMISDNYSAMKMYKVGDLCIYNNALYRCKTEISVGEAWNSSHWEKTTISNNIQKHLITGQEIITNEYIDEKRVYAKRFNIGNLPNSDTKTIITDLNDEDISIVDFNGIAVGESNGRKYILYLPDIHPRDPQSATRLTLNSDNHLYNIIVTAGTNRTNYVGYVNLYYTKNS